MDQAAAAALAEALSGRPFDEGLVVRDVRVVGLPDQPLLLVRFLDRPAATTLGAWWDFHSVGASELRDPDVEFLAGLAKAFLEEVFHAGGPIGERPRDRDGLPWAELDWRGPHRLPPLDDPG